MFFFFTRTQKKGTVSKESSSWQSKKYYSTQKRKIQMLHEGKGHKSRSALHAKYTLPCNFFPV